MTSFKVASVSSNRNSFGLFGMILVAQDGEAWEVAANDVYVLKKGDHVLVSDDRDWSAHGYEIPRQLKPDAPPAVVRQVWGKPRRKRCP